MAGITLRDFPQRTQAFANHWKETNLTLSDSPVILSQGYSVEMLEIDREAFLRKSEEIVSLENSEREHQNQVDLLRSPQRERITQLKATVSAFLAGSLYVKQLPTLPGKLASQEVFRKACVDASEVWGRIDADTSLSLTRPLVLPGGVARAAFLADTEALLAAWDQLALTRQRLKTVRTERDALVRAVSPRLTQYKKAVVAVLPVGHALLSTLPA